MRQVLGLTANDDATLDGSTFRTLVASTPTFRMRLMVASRFTISAGRAPYLLTALSVLAALARSAGMTTLTYQSLSNMLERQKELLLLLTHSNRSMAWKPDVTIDLSAGVAPQWRPRYHRIVKGLLRKAGSDAPMGDVLCEHLPPDPVERAFFLKQVGRALFEKIEPRDSRGAKRAVTWRPRARLQHWVLTRLEHDTFERLAKPQ